MNHTYRLIFNRSLGLWQVVSETARSRSKGGRGKGASRKAATAALLLSTALVAPAWAQTPTPGGGASGNSVTPTGEIDAANSVAGGASVALGAGQAGVSGTTTGQSGGGGGAGVTGGAGGDASNGSGGGAGGAAAVCDAAGCRGGDGGDGSPLAPGNGGGGGGAHGYAGAAIDNALVLQGGRGGNGAIGGGKLYGPVGGGPISSGGAGGGAGGYGAVFTGDAGTQNSGSILGGAGGNGGEGHWPAGSPYVNNGSGGDGGDGGLGLVFTGTGGAAFINSGTVAGGAGGNGMQSAGSRPTVGGTGGTGGAALVGSGLTITNTGTLRGGAGGAGGSSLATPAGGDGGAGGAGIVGGDLTIINSGTIAGGAGGTGGAGDSTSGANGADGNAITFTGGNNTLTLDTGSTISGNIDVTGTLTVDQAVAGNLLSGANLIGSGSLIVTGSGSLDLTPGVINSLAGGTTVSGGGTLYIVGNDQLGAAGVALTLDNGTLNTYTTDPGISRNIVLGAGGGTLKGHLTTISGAISGSGDLTIDSMPAYLSGADTHTGKTTIQGSGSISTTAADVLSASSAYALAAGGTRLNLLGRDQTIGSLAGAGDVSLGSATLTTGGDDTSTTYSGVMSGTGGLVKTGAGTFTLTGTNTYTGATTVTGGTLENASSLASAVTVQAGASFGNSGSMNTPHARAGFNNSPAPAAVTASGGSVSNSGSIVAGDGNGDYQTSGGGVGVALANGATLNNSGTIQGGNGKWGASASDDSAGGAGVTMAGDGNLLNHTGGSIRAGDFSTNPGVASAGVAITGNDNTLITAAAISGGSDIGKPQGKAVSITGNGNTLELRNGYSFSGGIAVSGSGNTLALGGATDASFNLSTLATDFAGFDAYAKRGASTWTLTGTTAATGGWSVESGTLAVNGSIADAAVTVQSGATLSGSGTVGSTTVQSGGHIAPGNSIGTLTVNGDLTLAAGSNFDVELGASGTAADPASGKSDRINVSGNLAFDGTVNLAQSSDPADGTAGIGYYRLITYGGDLTSNTATIGTTLGLTDVEYELQAGSGRVDLFIDAAAVLGDDALQHWQGGDGTWNASNMQWLNSGSSTPTAWAGHHAVFKNEPGGFNGGTIAVEGAQSFEGLQFVDDGYRLEGSGQLVTNAAGSEIRVLADSATIETDITGTGGLTKTEAGALVLTGDNTYSGGTVVSGGTLEIAGGSITHTVADIAVGRDGGDDSALLISGGSVSNRAAFIGFDSFSQGTATVTGGTWTNSGEFYVGLGGTGVLNIDGGSVTNSSDSFLGVQTGSEGTATVTGGTWINSSDLYVGYSGFGTLNVDGGLVSSPYTVAAVDFGSTGTINLTGGVLQTREIAELDGTGAVTFDGGTLRATGNNANIIYGFEDGDVTIGAGGAFIDSNGFDIGIAVGMDGAGGLTKTEAGTLVLTGNNTYSGGTTINAGTLQVGEGGTSGSIVGDVVNNGTLAFNRNVDTTFAGAISGTGMLIQDGNGTLTLTGNNSYTGQTRFYGNGTLQVGNGGTTGSLGSGAVFFVDGVATLAFNRSDDVVVSQNITEDTGTAIGSLIQRGTGTTTLTGANSYSGATTVEAGTLVVNGSIADSVVTVQSGATLGGSGTVGSTTVQSGGTLAAGNSIGTLDVAGDLTLSSGSFLDFELGSPGTAADPASGKSDRLNVSGNLAFDGTVNLAQSSDAADGTAGIGYYRLITYGGDLTSNTATIGTTPAAPTGVEYELQAGSGRVDLFIDAAAVLGDDALQHWQGGDGTWSASNTQWLNAGGDTPAAWAGHHAVFKNEPGGFSGGTIAVEGAQSFEGIQFVDDGYRLEGSGQLVTNAAGSEIRVLADSATIAAQITGTGGLTKTETGTLVLTDNNTYSGGTTISGGTLQVGNGGTTGSLGSGAVFFADGVATLAFNRSDDVVINQNITEDTGTAIGSLIQRGTGTLTLQGTNTYSGGTTVEAGTLVVNGSIADSAVTVQSGATLAGSGTVGGTTVQSGGTLAPGNSIGTLNAGNITFNTGSTYEVEVEAAGQSDRIAASGTATIAGGTVQVLAGAGNYAPQTRYTVLTANGGVTGSFADVTSNLAFLDPSLGYDAGNVYLTMTRNAISFAGIGGTRNQIATGRGVESLEPSHVVYDTVLNLSADQARAAFDGLSGEIHASMQTALVEDSRFVRNAANDRLRAAQAALGASTAPVAAHGASAGAPAQAAADHVGPAFWAHAFGSSGSTDGDGNAVDLDRDSRGLLIGADSELGDWRVGALAGYGHTSVKTGGRDASGESSNYHLGAYAGTAWGNLALRTGAAYTRHELETRRNVAMSGYADRLSGDYRAGTLQAFGELGYAIDAGGTRLEPFASLAHAHLRSSSYAEQGDAAALAGRAKADVSFSSLGMRAEHSATLGATDVTLRGMLGWRHAFGDEVPGATHRFQGGETFTVAGEPIAKNAAVVEAGLDFKLAPDATLGVSYAGQIANDTRDHGAKLNLSVRF